MRWSCPTAGKVHWLWQRKGVAPHNDWEPVPGPRCQGSDSRKAGWSHEGPTQQAAPTPSLHCWLLNRPVAARVTADEQPKPRLGPDPALTNSGNSTRLEGSQISIKKQLHP